MTDYWQIIDDRLLTVEFDSLCLILWNWLFTDSSSLCIFVDGLILISSSLTKLCNSNMLSKDPISLKLTSNEYISNNRFER